MLNEVILYEYIPILYQNLFEYFNEKLKNVLTDKNWATGKDIEMTINLIVYSYIKYQMCLSISYGWLFSFVIDQSHPMEVFIHAQLQ